jgi:large subunit ribosomal protein L24
MTVKLKIKKGDQVVVITGRDKGKRGEVLKVLPRDARVIVQGVNVAKRHTRPSAADPSGGIRDKELSIHISNVAHIDPKSGKPTGLVSRWWRAAVRCVWPGAPAR